jgi:hypothetical protein
MARAYARRPATTTLAASEAGNAGSTPAGRRIALLDAENAVIACGTANGPTLVAPLPLATYAPHVVRPEKT